MAKDDGCLADASKVKYGMFRVTFLFDYQIDNLCDISGLIKGSIHVVDRDGSGRMLCVQFFN